MIPTDSVRNRTDRESIRALARKLARGSDLSLLKAEEMAVQIYREVLDEGAGSVSEGSVTPAMLEKALTKMADPQQEVAEAEPSQPGSIYAAGVDPGAPLAQPPAPGADPGATQGGSQMGEQPQYGMLPWQSGSQNAGMIASGAGRAGPRVIPDSILNAPSDHYGEGVFRDTIQALLYHTADSATMGLSTWVAKQFGASEEDRARWRETEHWAATGAKWAGTMLGFLLPMGPLGAAAKGVKAVAGSTRVGEGIAKGLDVLDAATNTGKIFKNVHKGIAGATAGALRIPLGGRGAGHKVKREVGERVTKALTEAGVDAAEVKATAKAAKGSVWSAIVEGMTHKKWANPEILKGGVAKDYKHIASAVFTKKLTEKLTKQYGDDATAKIMSKDIEGIFHDALTKHDPKTIAQRVYGTVAGRWGAVAARTAEMMVSDSLAVALHGTMSRLFHAKTDPTMHGLSGAEGWDGWKEALGYGVTGGTEDWSYGWKGDVVYGGVLGGSALYKGLIPALGRRANPSWQKSFMNLFTGPTNKKDIAKYQMELGAETAKVLEDVSSLNSSKKLKNPFKAYRQLVPDMQGKKGGKHIVNDLELETIARSHAKKLETSGPMTEARRAMANELKVLASMLKHGSPEAREKIAGIIEAQIKDGLGKYRGALAKGLAKDAAKNVAVAANIAVWGGGKLLYDGYQRGEVEWGNIFMHVGFSFLAANDPFWNVGHARGGGWRADRKKGKYLGEFGPQPDFNEMPGYMGEAVIMNRIRGELLSMGITDGDYVMGDPNRPNKLNTSVLRGRRSSEVWDSVLKKMADDSDSADPSMLRQDVADEMKIYMLNEQAQAARDGGEAAMSHPEIVAALQWAQAGALSGRDLGPSLTFDTGQGLGTLAETAVINAFIDPSTNTLKEGADLQKLARLGWHLRGEVIASGVRDKAVPLSVEALSQVVERDTVRTAGQVRNALREFGDAMRGTQEQLTKVTGDPSAPLRRVAIDSPAYADVQGKYNQLVKLVDHVHGRITDSDVEPWVLRPDGADGATRMDQAELAKLSEAERKKVIQDEKLRFADRDQSKIRQIEGLIKEAEDRLNEVLELTGNQRIALDDRDLPEWLGRVQEAYQDSIVPALMLYRERAYLGADDKAIDFDNTILSAFMQTGMVAPHPNPQGRSGVGPKPRKRYIMFRPDFAAIEGLSGSQRRWLEGAWRVLSEHPDIEIAPYSAKFNYKDKTITRLFESGYEIKHADPAQKDFEFDGGLKGALEAAGIHFDSSGMVDMYSRSLSAHVKSRVSEATKDFHFNLAERFGLVKNDPERGRVYLFPLKSVMGIDGDVEAQEIGNAFLRYVEGMDIRPEEEMQYAFTKENAETFGQIMKELIDAGIINGFAEPTRGPEGTMIGEGGDYFVFEGKEGRERLRIMKDALEVYASRASESETGQMVREAATAFGDFEASLPQGPEGQEARWAVKEAVAKMTRLFSSGRVTHWRQLVHFLGATKIITIGDGLKRFKVSAKINMKNVQDVLKFVNEFYDSDIAAAYMVRSEGSAESAIARAQEVFDAIPRSKKEGQSAGDVFAKLGIEGRENTAPMIKAIRALQPETLAMRHASGLDKRTLSDHVREILSDHIDSSGYISRSSTQDQARAELAEMGDEAMLSVLRGSLDNSVTELYVYGVHQGSMRTTDLDGRPVPDMATTRSTDWLVRTESGPRNALHRLQDQYGHNIRELSTTAAMGKGDQTDLLRDPAMLAKIVDQMFLDGAPPRLSEPYGAPRGHREFHPGGAENVHFVATALSDLSRIVLHQLPDSRNAKKFGEQLKILMDRYRSTTESHELRELMDFVEKYKKVLDDNAGQADSDAIWDYSKNHYNELKNLFHFITFEHALGQKGIHALFSPAGARSRHEALMLGADGRPLTSEEAVSRLHQVYSKGSTETNPALLTEAMRIVEAKRGLPRGAVGLVTREGKQKLRIVITPDKTVDGRPVTFMDSHTPLHRSWVDIMYTMNGFDVLAGEYAHVKANVVQMAGGRLGDSNMMTKTNMHADPAAQGILEHNNIAMVISESEAKLMFGDYLEASMLHGAPHITAADGSPVDGKDFRDIMRNSQRDGRTIEFADSMIAEIDVDAVRFQMGIEHAPDRATLSLQTENWMDSTYMEAFGRAYMGDDAGFLGAVRDLFQQDPMYGNMVLRAFFDSAIRDGSAEANATLDAQMATAALRSSPHSSPLFAGMRRHSLGTLKRRLHETMLFKAQSTSGSKSPLDPDYNNTLGTGDTMVPHFMARRKVDINNLRIGLKRYSLVDGDDYTAVDAEQARLFPESFKDRQNHYNKVADGEKEIDGRRSPWNDYKIISKDPQDSIIYNGIMEFVGQNQAGVGIGGQRGDLGNTLLADFRRATPAQAQEAAAVLSKIWMRAVSHSEGYRSITLADAQQVVDALGVSGIAAQQVRGALVESTYMAWNRPQALGEFTPRVEQGTILKSLDRILGAVEGGQHRGYQHGRRWGTSDVRDMNDATYSGLTPVTYGILGLAQRSPSARPNDTIPIHVLGHQAAEAGSSLRMGYEDAVKIGEADFDKDVFNYWFDMPDRAIGEIMQIRNITGELEPAERITFKQATGQDFNIISKTGRQSDDHLLRYMQEQHNAQILRGKYVNAQKAVYRLLADNATVSWKDASGRHVTLKPIVQGISNNMDERQAQIREMNQAVQQIFDSKKGMIPNSLKETDPFQFAIERFFHVEYSSLQVGQAPTYSAVTADHIAILQKINSVYQMGHRIMGDEYMGGASRGMTYEGMRTGAADYYSFMGLSASGAMTGRGASSKISDFINYLGAGKDVGVENVRLEINHQETALDKIVRKVLQADELINPNHFTMADGHNARTLRQHGIWEATAGSLSTEAEAFIPRFYGTKWQLEQLVEHLKWAETTGDQSAPFELQMRRDQLSRMQERLDSTLPYDRQPEPGMETSLAYDDAVSAYGYRSAAGTLFDPNPMDMTVRVAAAERLRRTRDNLRRLRIEQLTSDGPTPRDKIVTEELLQNVLESEFAMYLRQTAPQADSESVVRAIFDAVDPGKHVGVWQVGNGESINRFKPFPQDLLRAAWKVDPVNTEVVLKILQDHMGMVDRMMRGDPAGLIHIRQLREDATLEGMNVGMNLRRLDMARLDATAKKMDLAQRIMLQDRLLEEQIGYSSIKEELSQTPEGQTAEGARTAEVLLGQEAAKTRLDLVVRLEKMMNRAQQLDGRHKVSVRAPELHGDLPSLLPHLYDSIDKSLDFDLDGGVRVGLGHRRGVDMHMERLRTMTEGDIKAQNDPRFKDDENAMQAEIDNRIGKMMKNTWQAMEWRYLEGLNKLPRSDQSMRGGMGPKMLQNQLHKENC